MAAAAAGNPVDNRQAGGGAAEGRRPRIGRAADLDSGQTPQLGGDPGGLDRRAAVIKIALGAILVFAAGDDPAVLRGAKIEIRVRRLPHQEVVQPVRAGHVGLTRQRPGRHDPVRPTGHRRKEFIAGAEHHMVGGQQPPVGRGQSHLVASFGEIRQLDRRNHLRAASDRHAQQPRRQLRRVGRRRGVRDDRSGAVQPEPPAQRRGVQPLGLDPGGVSHFGLALQGAGAVVVAGQIQCPLPGHGAVDPQPLRQRRQILHRRDRPPPGAFRLLAADQSRQRKQRHIDLVLDHRRRREGRAAHRRPAVDHQHAAEAAGQPLGHQGAGNAGADDDHRVVAVACGGLVRHRYVRRRGPERVGRMQAALAGICGLVHACA